MKYEFPKIEHIDDIKHLIDDSPYFISSTKQHFTTLNYVCMDENTFPEVTNLDESMMRELRGLKFCKETGKILQRPFHKFFNVNERDETRMENIPMDNHIVMEKLDGSMVSPIKITHEDEEYIRWTTKMGITDVSMQAEVFIAKNPKYVKFAEDIIGNNQYTPIFEFISPRNRIVIDYEEENLILLAVRNTITGEYLARNIIKNFAKTYDIPCVTNQENIVEDLHNYHTMVSQEQNREGVIIQFDDGHMVKIKTEEYVLLHRAKEYFNNEKRLFSMVIKKETDDLKSLLMEEDRLALIEYEKKVNTRIHELKNEIINIILDMKEQFDYNRKEFAVSGQKINHKLYNSIIFFLWDKTNITPNDVMKSLMKVFEKNVYREQKYNSIKSVFKLPSLEKGN